ncbi:N-end-recognizing protein, UBR ubiquitin-protein ligase E3 Ubr1 [Schizosaccharomyces osmophilus]|uniref:E3 ubiquitin-protein ligase n=1 Tax=Schizosaccharomyces osmophilus TaxID=2545709 RepID=A0AAE9WC83_9SCHI|nr:N-end-recognizing protein, UBR ubiquitin-protein ligase E3 Ubr1 [Schizosaccharomyces osmophilus]WBW73165.1 N-end-recognizing protein, UBR ubiquitin-protein ligase E3 Ubr1 [Schizosaccharomyces osmophilus]
MVSSETNRPLSRCALIRRRLLLFLQSHALMYSFMWSESAKKSLLNEVFSALLGYDHTLWQAFLSEKPVIGPSFKLRYAQGHREGDEYRPGICGLSCGRIFKKGEVFYRCKTCSIDSNSALCVKCFRATNHHGHETSFTISAGSGGCCDCGNPSAWIRDMPCKIHNSSQNVGETQSDIQTIDEKLALSIKTTIECVLDFILDVFHCSPENLKKMPTYESIIEDEHSSRLSEDKYGDIDDSCNLYSLMLWNDEKHSFKQFYEQITIAFDAPSDSFGQRLSNIINDTGRACVVTDSNIKELLRIGHKLAQINLTVTIRSMRDTFREECCGVLVEWLADIAGSKVCGDGRYFRTVICQELLRPWVCGLQSSIHSLKSPSYAESKIVAIDNPDAFLSETHDRSVQMLLQSALENSDENELDADAFHFTSHWTPSYVKKGKHEVLSQTRFDYFFLYDLKLWKSLRYKLQELYLGYFINVPGFKEIMGARIAILYRRLAELFLLLDREPEHSVIFFSMQIFTVFGIAKVLISDFDFLTTVNATLYTFFTYKVLSAPNFVDDQAIIRVDSAAFHSRRYIHIFHHIQFMLGIDCVAEAVREDHRFLRQYVDFFSLFQGMSPYTRAISQHVEWESDSWMYVLNVSLQVAKLCRHVGNVFSCLDPDKLKVAIDYLNQTIIQPRNRPADSWSNTESSTTGTWKDTNGMIHLVEYDIGAQPISFHHPLHWLLTYLLAFHMRKVGYEKAWCESDLLRVVDHPLRVCAWLAQMRSKLWIRNGTTLRDQAHHYRNLSFHEYTFDLDLTLLQLVLVYGNPNVVLPIYSERYQLSDQFIGNYFARHKHYDVPQLSSMFEEFMLLLISLVSHTAILDDWSMRDSIKYEIAHLLCFQSLSYSEISKRVCEHFLDERDFEKTLHEITHFRPAEGINDTGTFALKDEYFNLIDPFSVHYSRNQREEAEIILRKKYAKRHDKQLDDVVYEAYHPIITSTKTLHVLQSDAFLATLWHSVNYCYLYPSDRGKCEGLLLATLHACLIALNAEKNGEPRFALKFCETKFPVVRGLDQSCNSSDVSLFTVLYQIKDHTEFAFARKKLNYLFSILKERIPSCYEKLYRETLTVSSSKVAQSLSEAEEAEQRQGKIRLAKERQRRIMEQFRLQQNKFLENNTDFELSDAEMDDADTSSITSSLSTRLFLEPPVESCLLCQEELRDKRPYGTLAFIQRSSILRYLPSADLANLQEIYDLPVNLDQTLSSRPFGMAAHNKHNLDAVDNYQSYTSDKSYSEFEGVDDLESKDILKGFPSDSLDRGLYANSCGHLMHIDCFKNLMTTVTSTTRSNPYRNHPHNLSMKEFLCPLCKGLCNTILPFLWRPKEELNSSEVKTNDCALTSWLFPAPVPNELMSTNQLYSSADTSAQSIGPYNPNFLDVLQNTFKDSLKDVYTLNAGNKSTEDLTSNSDSYLSIADSSSFKSIPSERKSLEDRLVVSEDIFELYRRLNEVVDLNSSLYSSEYLPLNGKITNVLKLFSYTLAQVELSARGNVKAANNALPDVWLYNISKKQQVFLRVLSETVKTYTLLCAHDSEKSIDGSMQEYELINYCQQKRLFGKVFHSLEFPLTNAISDDRIEPLLEKDPFREFAEASVSGLVMCEESFHVLTQLYYLSDIVKNLWVLLRSKAALVQLMHDQSIEMLDSSRLEGFQSLVFRIWQLSGLANHSNNPEYFNIHDLYDCRTLSLLYHFMERFELVFLRKSALLWYCRYGVSFEGQTIKDGAATCELKRLESRLQLDNLETLASKLLNTNDSREWSIVEYWCRSLALNDSLCESPRLYSPCIPELVSLPFEHDKLFELLLGKKCSKCLSEPLEPAICLFCGQFLCFQSHCCAFNGIGECNLHIQQCAGDVGIFFIAKRCAILYLNPPLGSFAVAPFLDTYGEPDLGLRRGRSQYLSQKRYDESVRNTWLNGFVPSFIARKLDGVNDTGGWETL